MSEYMERQRTRADVIQEKGPAYAAAFGKITGKMWRYVDPRKPGDIDSAWHTGFTLDEVGTGITIGVHERSREGKMVASVNWPSIPDGGAHGGLALLRDFYVVRDEKHVKESPEAGVSFGRFMGEVDACARRFVKLVYVPALDYWPDVLNHIASKRENFSVRDRVLAELGAEFGGMVHNNSNGSIRMHFPGSLPTISVGEAGHIRLDYTPTFSAATLRAYFNAVLAEKSAG
jgi:hypothetical protein